MTKITPLPLDEAALSFVVSADQKIFQERGISVVAATVHL
jgi:hypothetical protein